ncbi:unnamed protein product [Musa acuminata subsp. malaccensis]|nr:unnamed protein product [Musa acuminata subsp. malaccensis]
MEFFVELLVTALISVLLAFIISKIAAAAAADDADLPEDKSEVVPLAVDVGPRLQEASYVGRGFDLDPIEEETEEWEERSGVALAENNRLELVVADAEEQRLGQEVSGFVLEKEIIEEESTKKKEDDEAEIRMIVDGLVKQEERFDKDEANVGGAVEKVVELGGEYAAEVEDVKVLNEEKGTSFLDGEDDWEGIERSELEKLFGEATEFVHIKKGGDAVLKLNNEAQMQLYGLQKIATEGPCNAQQPMALRVSARSKWHAWQRLGNMNPEVAMEQYVCLLTENIPGWMAERHNEETKGCDGNSPLAAEASGTGLHDSKAYVHHKSETERLFFHSRCHSQCRYWPLTFQTRTSKNSPSQSPLAQSDILKLYHYSCVASQIPYPVYIDSKGVLMEHVSSMPRLLSLLRLDRETRLGMIPVSLGAM